MTVAETDKEGGAVVAKVIGGCNKYGVSDERDEHAFGGIMREATFTEGFASLDAREHEPDGAEHEPGAGATGHAEYLFTIDGEVVAEDAEAETEEDHIDAKEPAAL